MATNAGITLIEEAKTSVNLLPEFCTFNEPYNYNITSGAGNISVENSTEYPLYGERSMKVRFLGNVEAYYNATTETKTIIKVAGEYFLALRMRKNDPSADVTLKVEVTINDNLAEENIFVCNAYSTSGYTDGVINTFYFPLNFLANDEVLISWSAQSDTIDSIIYVDGFDLKLNDKGFQNPPFYSEPINLAMRWQQRVDNSTVQTLIEGENGFVFAGVSTSNCSNILIFPTGGFAPTRQGAIFRIVTAFDAIVPTGLNVHVDIVFKINDVIMAKASHLLYKNPTESQPIYNIFDIPVTADFIQYGGEIYLTPQVSEFDIENRKTIATQFTNL